jgi:hypothetical protein
VLKLLIDFNNAVEWLRTLDHKLWPRIRATSDEAGSMSSAERRRVVKVLEHHRASLMFEPCSGTFGFGVGLVVYVPKPAPYPGVPDDAERLLTVTDKQMFRDRSARVDQDVSYAFVSGFVYTDLNKELRTQCGRTEPLRGLSSYDY